MAETLLLIDDDETFLRLAVRVLADRGYRVVAVSTPRHAIHEARRVLPDLVLADVEMPDVDGFALFDMFRSDPILRHVPFIFWTQHDTLEERMAGFQVGADDYITKPIVLPDLLARVANAIERRKQRMADAADGPSLAGNLSVLSLAELLQSLAEARRSGTLTIESQNVGGEVALREGKLSEVRAGHSSGLAALVTLLCLSTGRFSFEPEDSSAVPPGMNAEVTATLLEASRIMDERDDGRGVHGQTD